MLIGPRSVNLPKPQFPLSRHAAYFVEPCFDAEANDFILENYDDLCRYFRVREHRLVYFPMLFGPNSGVHYSPLTSDVMQRLWGRDISNFLPGRGFIVPSFDGVFYGRWTFFPFDFVMDDLQLFLRDEHRRVMEALQYQEISECVGSDYDEDDDHDYLADEAPDVSIVEEDYIVREMTKPSPAPPVSPSPRRPSMPPAASQMPKKEFRRFEMKKADRSSGLSGLFGKLRGKSKAPSEKPAEKPSEPRSEFSDELIKKAEQALVELAETGITKELLLYILKDAERFDFVRMVVTPSLQIVLKGVTLDRGDAMVDLPPLQRAIYFLYLRHTEGINFKDLMDHYQEVFDFYVRMSRALSTDAQRESVNKALAPASNRINVLSSNIRHAFLQLLPPEMANYYCITGTKGNVRSIKLDRKYVEWAL